MPVFKDNERNTYYVKCYYTDYTGKRKQKLKRGFKLQREAKEWERNFLEVQQGTPDMTFQALYDIYIEDISHRQRQNSVDGKKNVFKNRILPFFKDKPINTIIPADIRAWQNEQITAGYSDAYLDRIQNNLTTIFNYAVNYYNLPSNPCDKAGHMGKRTRSMKFWTLDQYNTIMEHITDVSAKIAIETLFYSGMRCGELLALTPADLDFNTNTIDINKSIQIRASGNLITPPKTTNGIRTITMPDVVMNDIQAYCNMNYGLLPEERIFSFTKTLIRNHMMKAADASGLPFIRIHDLRHSHACRS